MIRKALGVATAALILSLGAGQLSAEAACLIDFGNKDVKYVAYEAIPSAGREVDAKFVSFSSDYPKLYEDSKKDSEVAISTMTITLENATFKNYENVALIANAHYVNKDNEKDTDDEIIVIKPYQSSPERLDFKFEEVNKFIKDKKTITKKKDGKDTTYNLTEISIVKLTELKTDGTTPADKLTIWLPGTVKAGDKAQIVITGINKENEHVGCVKKDFLVVENQYVAKKPGVDEEGLAVVIEDDKAGVLKVYDDEISDQPLNYALYNPCITPGSTGPCCEHTDIECTAFCSNQVEEVCADPGYCDNKTSCICSTKGKGMDGLRILQGKDMEDAVIKVTSLANSNVTLSLKGDMKGVTKVEFVAPNYKTYKYDVLCSATPENGVASCTVSGSTLFQNSHVNPDTKSIDVSFKVYVDGKTQLAPQAFYASAEISGGQLYKAAKLDWGKVMVWGQSEKSPVSFKVPYVRTDSLITTAIRVENTGDDTPLILYVSDPKGGWKFIKAIAVGAGQEVIIKGTDIVKWAKDVGLDLMAEKEGRFGVLGITGTSSKNLNIYVAQQVIGTTNVRFVPVELVSETPDNLHF